MAIPQLAPSPTTTILPSDPEHQREDRVAHIAPADKITEAYITGTPVEALCGAVFVPSRDPKSLPVCQACKEIFEGFILPMRSDHSINDDV
jgi:Protein of unknown function (DUF3039)